jgi:hypothetical protein
MYGNVSARASVAQCTTSHGLPTPTSFIQHHQGRREKGTENRGERNASYYIVPLAARGPFLRFRVDSTHWYTYRHISCVCLCVSYRYTQMHARNHTGPETTRINPINRSERIPGGKYPSAFAWAEAAYARTAAPEIRIVGRDEALAEETRPLEISNRLTERQN